MAHTLLFEIWEELASNSFEMSPVTEAGDQMRSKIAPTSVLRHSFRAKSDFEAHQMNHDWQGWASWKPEPGWIEHLFTAEEAAVQEQYLAARRVRDSP
jgi:hypothetical protein